MKLNLGVAARDRNFLRAMRRIRPQFDSLAKAFSEVELVHSIHKAILVGITDEHGADFFQEVPNGDGYFQVLAGCEMKTSDAELAECVFGILRRAAKACPFAKIDDEAVQKVFDAFAPKLFEA